MSSRGPPWSGGPGAIAPVDPTLIRPCLLSKNKSRKFDIVQELRCIIFALHKQKSNHTQFTSKLLQAIVKKRMAGFS